jgi:hypothetical protein
MPSDADSALTTTDNFRNFTATSSYGRHAMSLYLTSAVEAAENQSMRRPAGAKFRAASLRLLRPAPAARLADSATAAQSLQLLPCGGLRARQKIRPGSAEVPERRCRWESERLT